MLNQNPKGSAQHDQAKQQIANLESQIESVKSDPQISFKSHREFSHQVDSALGCIKLFPAVRQANIQDARSASGINYKKENLRHSSSLDIGNQIEQHLVNLYTRRSFAITERKDTELEKVISSWLTNFDDNLKFLMEDESVYLDFDADNFKFHIKQNGKIPYTFQNLSSGYSAIFSIFSTLLMRAEYLKVSPSELCGVAIIDEIDAHLHVTLQRKILPFLSDSFPSIQFIVTTHSPFVITSVCDAEIYDISKREQVGDLSSYSYEAVLEGLFGVSSASDILQNKIRNLSRQIYSKNPDIDEIRNLIVELEKVKEKLDEEARFHLNNAKLKLLQFKQGADR